MGQVARSMTRVGYCLEEVRLGWFTILKEMMTKHPLLDKPNQIFNVDETGFFDETKRESRSSILV